MREVRWWPTESPFTHGASRPSDMLGLINLILNLAGVLLWLNWRSVRFDPLDKTTPATLVGTLRRAEPRRLKRWHFVVVLGALLLFRALVYWQIGAAVNWTPNLHLGGIDIAIPFRSDHWSLMLLYSLLSFGVTLGVFYLSLLLLSLVNGRTADEDPLQRLVRLHLGHVDRWPWPVKTVLPFLVALTGWFLTSLLLARFKIIPPPLSTNHRLEQAVVVSLASYLIWKYLIGVLLALHLITSYIYFGNQPFWNFVTLTGRNLLAPLRLLPLQLGKVDFAPLAGVALVFLAAYWAERGLTLLFKHLPL
jgi:uncharacterized protein YggT (Ycf19 family)